MADAIADPSDSVLQAVVSGVALLFSAFSSPFLTAVFTFGVFIVGRSARTLAARSRSWKQPA